MNILSIKPDLNWSDVPLYKDIIHFVEMPTIASQNVLQQLRQVLELANQSLADAGCDKSQIISVNIYLTKFDELAALNHIWNDWLPKSCSPSRAYLKTKFNNPNHLIEIGFIATTN